MPTASKVLTITDSKTSHLNVDFQDVTGQIINLGAHGTKCRYPIADNAIYSIRAPAIKYRCANNDNEVDVVIPVPAQTDGRVLLNGFVADITLEALEPAWPHVTDAGDLGYFYRLRNRTRRWDFLQSSKAREDAAMQGQAPPAEPVEEFEYHPEASLELAFAPAVGVDPNDVKQISTGCTTVTATDRDLEKSGGARGYTPSELQGNDRPKWAMNKGTLVSGTVAVTEYLPYPDPNASQPCTWVEFPGGDTVHPVNVRHTNKLGLSNEDIVAFQMDSTTAEKKEFNKILAKTLNLENEPPALAAAEEQLQKCSIEGVDKATCEDPVGREEETDETAKFGSDYTCTSAYSDETNENGNTVMTLHSGYMLALNSDETQMTACVSFWNTEGVRTTEDIVHMYQPWHSIQWGSLSLTEQGYWETVGVDIDDHRVADAYRNAQGQSIDSWSKFSEMVYMAGEPWDKLSAAAKEALDKLEFGPETWGRQWALLERVFHKKVTLTWGELTANEKTAMMALGWDVDGMALREIVQESFGPGINATLGDSCQGQCLRFVRGSQSSFFFRD